jgi:hypothetical protein
VKGSRRTANLLAGIPCVLAFIACSASPGQTIAESGPMCTQNAMAQYIPQHPIPRLSGPANPTVTRTIAATAAELNRIENTALTIPGATPVCYVELQGPFVVFGPPGKSTSYARGFEVFRTSDWQLVASGAMN